MYKPPAMELARTLWTVQKPPQKVITAEIFVVETGRELRIRYGTDTNLLLSELSRIGDGPLEGRAAAFKELLESKGWCNE